MPAPQALVLQKHTRVQFAARRLTVPTDWSPPTGEDAVQFAEVSSKAGVDVVPDPSPPALFRAASSHPLHVETQRNLSRSIGAYLDGVSASICGAWKRWQEAASMTGITVTSMTASGGTLTGPVWEPLIMASAPRRTPLMLQYSMAIATAISNGWLKYEATIRIPELPFYPTFASFPGAVAPPTPNVPVPFTALAQVTTPISKAALKKQMIVAFDNANAQFADELFESVAGGFEEVVTAWRASTMVTKVIGTGPVPTYAPPLVPSGPVVAGTARMVSGGLV